VIFESALDLVSIMVFKLASLKPARKQVFFGYDIILGEI